ncbi:hypothetical protein C4J88_1896 [Pseudomonas sp. R4-39-08]|nr:hypothetical protein C4J88_1896 [Pseudomonas sp. R4-39-08]
MSISSKISFLTVQIMSVDESIKKSVDDVVGAGVIVYPVLIEVGAKKLL